MEKQKCSNKKCGWIGTTKEMREVRVKVNMTELHCPRCDSNSFLKAKNGEVEKVKSGAQLIDIERTRQIKIEGWSEKHDDEHGKRELASAGFSYLEQYVARAWVFTNELGMPGVTDGPKSYREEPPPSSWPWDDKWWKPTDPIRDLVKAGALIAAEIDRLQRLKP